MITSQGLGLAGALAALGAVACGLHWLRKRRRVHPEVLRKLAHLGTGLVTLSFPLLFRDAWPVRLLGVSSLMVLAAVRLLPGIRRRYGQVLHGVRRESLGELCFPVAVMLLWEMTPGQRVLYVIPLLMLVLADAVAALIGVRYGTVHYDTMEGRKSAEGSLAFFLTAFMSTHIPLLLWTQTGRAESLLLGLIMGALIMMLEAVSWRGLDNLFIPLGGLLLLKANLPLDVPSLLLRFAVIVALGGTAFLWRYRATLNHGALMAAALAGYLIWSLGGLRWLLPPLVLFATYSLFWSNRRDFREHPHDLRAVATVLLPALGWLFLAGTPPRSELFFPYCVSLASQMAFMCLHEKGGALGSVFKGWGVVMGTGLLSWEHGTGSAWPAAVSMIAVFAAMAGFLLLMPGRGEYRRDQFPWFRQGSIAAGASLLALVGLRLIP